MIVKFASLCDHDDHRLDGPARSPELTEWPTCRNCMAHCCPDHMTEGTWTDDERNLCLCIDCQPLVMDRIESPLPTLSYNRPHTVPHGLSLVHGAESLAAAEDQDGDKDPAEGPGA